ncbi:MAG: restriction endonuclease subunit S [Proteobacteria bacterium]|nr:restriction endonuclease subunit S [Pseudomonadota bacterium]
MAKQGEKTVTPRLRFPEFRGAKDWTLIELRQLAEFVTERVGATECIPYTITSGVGLVSQQEKLGRTIAGNSLKNYVLLQRNDFAYNKSATKTFPQGFIARYIGDERAAVPNSIFTCFRTNGEVINPVYLDGLFSTNLHGNWLRTRIAVGARAHGSLNVSDEDLMDLPVPLPDGPSSLTEQRKIADCLTSLDELIAAQGRMVEALKAHKRGLMQQLFPREGEAHPRLRFPEFRDAPEWAAGKASDIVEVLQGYGFPERLQGNKEAEFPFYKVSDISACVDAGGTFLADAKNHIDAAVLEELRARLLPAGTTVFAKIGEAIRSNKRAIVTRPCLVDNNAAGVKALQGLAEDRFVYYLWSQIPLIEYSGGVVPAVNKSTIEQIQVRYPDIDEQQRIADCLSSLDTKIAAASSQLSSLRLHKQGLMQQLFPTPMED